jgi:pimeloyl-ACP methyl ester carboxylesterase
MTALRKKRPPSAVGYAMQLLGAMWWSSAGFLERIPHETLVISGDDDPLIPLENARMLARRIPRATLEIVERAGHLFLWDDPEHLATRIRRFVDATPHLAAVARPA